MPKCMAWDKVVGRKVALYNFRACGDARVEGLIVPNDVDFDVVGA